MTASTPSSRLARLRQELARRELDGFIVPISDEHMSEYVGDYAQRLQWLTGFAGSAGSAVVLADKAAILVDGRYTVQVREQVDGALYEYCSVPRDNIADWARSQLARGGEGKGEEEQRKRIGYDPWLHTRKWVEAMRARLAGSPIELVAASSNPIDAIWDDQPARPAHPARPHPLEHAGEASSDKRARLAARLREGRTDAAVISALDSVAWLFNIRGSDIAHTPVVLAYAILRDDASAELFLAPEKRSEALIAHLGEGVRLRDYADFPAALGEWEGRRVQVDPDYGADAIVSALEQAGAQVLLARDPAILPKAIKNPVEQAGHRAAQARDGAALARFLHWLDHAAPAGKVDELSAARALLGFRRDTGALRDLSFDTISAAGPHAALPHYRVDDRSNIAIAPGSIYLVDSGGQYCDGTTDVTRTVWIGPGEPSAEMKDRYTRVLKGHIALDSALFPQGTTGSQLDALARQFLWQGGLDYAHGTGHGVGSYLSVHEGPQRIAKSTGAQAGTDQELMAGMILSNEPGYYKEGEYGIRIENLVLVESREAPSGEGEWLGFETLTFAPIDRRLIDRSLLSAHERRWLDDYHARVLAVIAPQLEGEALAWLERQCAPI